MKAFIIGDLHHRGDEPKCFQVPLLMEYLENNLNLLDYEYIIFAGDLVESVFIEHGYLSYYIDLFLNKLNKSKIIIVEGNHDKTLDTNIIDIFKPIKNVRVIDKLETLKLENTSFIFLPHYDHEGTNLDPMEVAYPKLGLEIIEKELNGYCDYGIGHITDQTQPGTKKVDTSHLPVKQWLNGHIHNPDIKKGGNYLGSPVLNSLSESGKTPLVASIDLVSKELKLFEVPKFVEYETIKYPESIKKNNKIPYIIYTITDSLDKSETLNYYRKQAEELGMKLYTRRVESKKLHNIQDTNSNKDKIKNLSYKEYLSEYIKDKSVSKEVASILEEAIK